MKDNEPNAKQCAGALLSVVPLLTGVIQQASSKAAGVSLTLPQFRVLGAIADKHEGSLADLARHLGVTPPSLSVMIVRLTASGLVEKTRIRREVRLKLTKLGQERYGQTIASLVNDLARQIAGMTSGERKAILITAEALQRAIPQGTDNYCRE